MIGWLNMIKHYPGEPQIYQILRGFGKNYLDSKPWPNRKDEHWKYNSLDVFKNQFNEPTLPKNSEQLELKKSLSSGIQIVFINGIFCEEKSTLETHFINSINKDAQHDQNLRIMPLKVAIEKGVYPKLDLGHPKHSFEALNLYNLSEGVYIEIKDNAQIDFPIEILFVDTTPAGSAFHPRLIVAMGKNSVATIFENYLSLNDNLNNFNEHNKTNQPTQQSTNPFKTQEPSNWTNGIVDVFSSENSKLIWAKIQNQSPTHLHFSKTQFNLEEKSHLHFLTVAIGGKFHKHDLNFSINGPQVELVTHGISIGRESSQIDHQVEVVFNKGESQLEQKFKSILNDTAQSIFTGKIVIQKYSQKINASQLCQNLLLSDKAEANTQPQLEIYADDVKAAHGATTGQLNADEIFYLQSRGISKSKAIQLLQSGFALELIEQFPNDLIKNYLKEVIL